MIFYNNPCFYIPEVTKIKKNYYKSDLEKKSINMYEDQYLKFKRQI